MVRVIDQRELFDRVDVAVADGGDEWKALIQKILRGPQGIIARVFDHLDDPLGLPEAWPAR